MNQSRYFDYIEENLNILATRINSRGRLNILNLHLHSENFYRDFFNELFNWELKNLNESKQNAEAIDLISDSKKIIIQVSATCTKEKIESALKKEKIKDYKGYCFKFISISKDASKLRKQTYINPHNISFNPSDDIYDVASILECIVNLDIMRQKEIYEFIKKELGSDIDIVKLDSNLALVINILAKEDFNDIKTSININPFEIERKITFNELKETKKKIDEYIIYHPRLSSKYTELDLFGANKSLSVLNQISRIYQTACIRLKNKNADKIFLQVIDNVMQKVLNSANFSKISIDELEFCIDIIVVDAFIRCKIFENPNNYKYVTA